MQKIFLNLSTHVHPKSTIFKNIFGDMIFDGILILAVWHNRTRRVFSRNAETTIHHCTTYVLLMYNMHPVA